MKKWYLARSKPQQENWLIDSFTSLGVEVFFPKIIRLRRGKQIDEPLFPTYAFCKLDDDFLEHATIRWAPGLSYFLGTNGTPASISDDLIQYFQASVDSWNERFTEREEAGLDLEPRTGPQPFKGLEGIFEKYIDPRRRCRLLLQNLGNINPLNIERDYLRTAIQVL